MHHRPCNISRTLRCPLGFAVSVLFASGCYVYPPEEADKPAGSSGEPGSSSGSAAGTDTSLELTTDGPAFCGDGEVEGDEECDDGDQDDADACTNACTVAVCGDGVVAQTEACDDGDGDDADECSNDCALATCGDGIVQAGEDCDDGGETATCDANCTAARCGDGVHNGAAGEACDDGDLAPGDGCSPACTATEIEALAMGGDFTCIQLSGGEVRCWGQGEFGVLGNGETDDLGNHPGELPVNASLLGGAVEHLSGGLHHACAVLTDGKVRCWGNNTDGELGNGAPGQHVGDDPDELPPADNDVGGEVREVAAGVNHTCALMTTGKVRCWGLGTLGMLGYGNAFSVPKPNKQDVPGIQDVEQVVTGGDYTCVLLTSGAVQCWGKNDTGQLGQGHTMNIGDGAGEMPPASTNLGGPATRLSAGTAHACALMTNGDVRCWGRGNNGALGTGGTESVGTTPGSLPVKVELGGPAIQVVASNIHTCALLADHRVKCWGDGRWGSLGYHDTQNRLAPPADAVELGAEVVMLGAAVGSLAGPVNLGVSTCAVLADYTLRCWGGNQFGQLGLGHLHPVGDGVTPFAEVPF